MSTIIPTTAAKTRAPMVGHRVYVWDLMVRITHWINAGAIAVLAFTGFYIGKPFIALADSNILVMGTVRTVHFYAAIAFTLSVLSRILWMFIAPSPHARWDQFIPFRKARWSKIKGTLAFYLFLRDRPPNVAGHNPVAGMAYLVVFGLYLTMILTGLGLYGMSADIASPMHWFGWLADFFGGPQNSRFIHHVVMWLLLGFAVQHIYSAVLFSIGEKNAAIDSIVSGHKWVEDDE